MAKYTIRWEEKLAALEGLGIGCNANNYTKQLEWTFSKKRALSFSSKEEAEMVIEFIRIVIGWAPVDELTIMEEPAGEEI